MKLIKIFIIIILISPLNTIVIAETKTDCSYIKTDTLSGIYDKHLCKKGEPPRKKLGTKLKELNPFKKKN
jgi:hypothetical protein